MSDEENLFAFLNRREQELTHKASALRSQLEFVENELAYVKKAKAATVISASADQQIPAPTQSASFLGVGAVGAAAALQPEVTAALQPKVTPSFAEMTIKQLVVQALLDHYHGGATLADLRKFIHNAYERSIEQSSLRPQMHRLKAQGIVDYFPRTETWNLRMEKRTHYALAKLQHPISGVVDAELLARDEEPETEKSDQPVAVAKGFDNPPFRRRKVKDDPLFDE